MSTTPCSWPARTLYTCPRCDYAVTFLEIVSARADYNCPRCGKAKLSEFLVLPEVGK